MILTIAAFLSTLGFAGWIAGHVFSYHGVAFLGAVLVVGVGAWIMVDGLEHQSGTVETVDNATNETTTERTYDTVQSPLQNYDIGALVLLFGGVLGLRSIAAFQEGG